MLTSVKIEAAVRKQQAEEQYRSDFRRPPERKSEIKAALYVLRKIAEVALLCVIGLIIFASTVLAVAAFA